VSFCTFIKFNCHSITKFTLLKWCESWRELITMFKFLLQIPNLSLPSKSNDLLCIGLLKIEFATVYVIFLGLLVIKLNMCDSTWLIFWIGNKMKEQNFKYLSSKIPPLRNLKMLEGQPMVEPFKVISSSYSRWMPLGFDNLKVYICFINCFGILIVVVDFHVFCLPLSQLNKPISVSFHGLNPMEKESFFFVVQWLGGLF